MQLRGRRSRIRSILLGAATIVIVVATTVSLRQWTTATQLGPASPPVTAVTTSTSPAGVEPATSEHPRPTMSAADTSSGGPSPSAASTDSGGQTLPNQPTGAKVVQWIADLGPLGGADGMDTVLYNFSIGYCPGILDSHDRLSPEPIYSLLNGADAACRIVAGDQSQWPTLRRAVEVVSPSAGQLDCIERPMFDVMNELIKIHTQNPDVIVKRSTGTPSPSRCPRIKEVSPNHGSRTSDTVISFTGTNLPRHVRVHILANTEQIVEVDLDGQRGTLTVPRTLDKSVRDLAIWPEGWALAPFNTAFFAYDEPPPPATGAADTPSPARPYPSVARTSGSTHAQQNSIPPPSPATTSSQ